MFSIDKESQSTPLWDWIQDPLVGLKFVTYHYQINTPGIGKVHVHVMSTTTVISVHSRAHSTHEMISAYWYFFDNIIHLQPILHALFH